jgi:2-C-methyl-D-erythritol 4-phosphate cytidylyltransferase
LAAISEISEFDSVLVAVHDAARPCLSVEHLNAVIAAAMGHSEGAILAVPVADTLKRASDTTPTVIDATVPRERLWQAQTPQVFELGLLRRALALAPKVTDEASAVEAIGLRPCLVPGDPSNFKVTYPQDLTMASLILRNSNSLETLVGSAL